MKPNRYHRIRDSKPFETVSQLLNIILKKKKLFHELYKTLLCLDLEEEPSLYTLNYLNIFNHQKKKGQQDKVGNDLEVSEKLFFQDK